MRVEKLQEWTREFDKAAGIDSTGEEVQIALHAAEEMGEIAQCVLKLSGWKNNRTDTLEHLEEEIADLTILMFKLANLYGIDMSEALSKCKTKLEKRWKVSVDK